METSTVPPDQRFLSHLEGGSLAIVAVSVVGCILSTMIVALRAWARVATNAFGLDDGLMVGGLFIYIADVAFACQGARVGLGARDSDLNLQMQEDSRMWLIIWMLVYICALAVIKSSICITMLRIATSMRWFRWAVYALLITTWLTWTTTFIGVLLLCRPVAGNWDLTGKVGATCATMDAMIALSYTSTASTILTDMACAILPAFLLYSLNMKLKSKILVGVLLSFASLASISTMVRTPYIEYYRNPMDNMPYHIGNIVLWSNIETAIGLIAGSLPSLRFLIMRKVGNSKVGDSSGPSSKHAGRNPNLVTIGSAPMSNGGKRGRGGFKNPTDTGVTVSNVYAAGEGDWERLSDSSSQRRLKDEQLNDKGGIRQDFTYEVEMSNRPASTRDQVGR